MKQALKQKLAAWVVRLYEEGMAQRDFSALCTLGPDSRIHPEGRIICNIPGADRITIGRQSHIRGELLTFGHGGRISIGDHCFVGTGTRIWSALSITIGNRALISHNVNIFDSDTHPIDDIVARHKQYLDIITTGHPREMKLNEAPVVIEEDTLICCQCIILPGVTIGRGAVVGAGSVVTRDVEPMTLVAGNPARCIRKLREAKA